MNEKETYSGMMSEEDFLDHAGVKGMKWGHRKAAGPKLGPDGKPQKTRKELRALDKASIGRDKEKLKKDLAANDKEIATARAKVKSGENAKMFADAKAKYKIDKKVIGKREASKALEEVRTKTLATYAKSKEAKSGAEATAAALVTIGVAAIGVGLAAKG